MMKQRIEITRKQAFVLGKDLIDITNMRSKFGGKYVILEIDETGEISALPETMGGKQTLKGGY